MTGNRNTPTVATLLKVLLTFAAPLLASLLPLPARAAGAPDLLIIAFSGHCGFACSTRDNWAYLGEASQETGGVAVLSGIQRAYEELGVGSVEVLSASSFVTAHYSEISGRVESGYLQAHARLGAVKRRGGSSTATPTRVVLVGHSHGVVWATLLALNNPDVRFDALISLDAVCWQWWGRHSRYLIQQFMDGPFSTPAPLERGDPCRSQWVAGREAPMNISDVVPENVTYGIEVRTSFRLLSLDPNVLTDDEPNVRATGGTENLWGIMARESHARLGRRYNDSIRWLEAMVKALGLPELSAPAETPLLPAPPEGFGHTQDP